MNSNFFGAVIAFLLGAALATASYLISRYLLKSKKAFYVSYEAAKKIVQIVFLVGLFTVGKHTPWDSMWLLVGGCLGITLPMIWFTYKLVKINDSADGKGDDTDG